MPTRVIVNPAAGRGQGARVLAEVRKAFAEVGVAEISVTEAAGDEYRLARSAIEAGVDTLVGVGGDGTWSNIANAILDSGADCRLALIAAGTGNDFAKTLGLPAGDFATMARLATAGPDLRIDVGRIENRYFLNIAGFGLDIAVLEDVERIPWLRGEALYLFSALRQLFGYRGVEIEIVSPRAHRQPAAHLMLVVANARYFGGAFWIAPGASLTDGRLDAISLHDASPLNRLRLFRAVANGTHIARPEVITEQAGTFRLSFPEPPAYETDGEYRRAAAAELEVACVPQALRIVAPGPVSAAM